MPERFAPHVAHEAGHAVVLESLGCRAWVAHVGGGRGSFVPLDGWRGEPWALVLLAAAGEAGERLAGYGVPTFSTKYDMEAAARHAPGEAAWARAVLEAQGRIVTRRARWLEIAERLARDGIAVWGSRA